MFGFISLKRHREIVAKAMELIDEWTRLVDANEAHINWQAMRINDLNRELAQLRAAKERSLNNLRTANENRKARAAAKRGTL